METMQSPSHERVVKIVEMCDGDVIRTFYCVYDPDFGHWMSREPFDGLIWTKDVGCRREFASRMEAEVELDEFLEWRCEQDVSAGPVSEIPSEREAA